MSKNDKIKEVKRDILNIDNSEFFTEVPDSYRNRKLYTPPNEKELYAMIPGAIVEIYVKVGQEVEEGEHILILEAMKMRNIVVSPIKGEIKSILVKIGDMVRLNQLIVEFK